MCREISSLEWKRELYAIVWLSRNDNCFLIGMSTSPHFSYLQPYFSCLKTVKVAKEGKRWEIGKVPSRGHFAYLRRRTHGLLIEA